jgi:hypothetical protein
MPHFFRAIAAIFVGFVTFFPSPSARAAFIVETVSITPSQQPTDFTQTLVVPTFNSALGTLTGIIFSDTDISTIQGMVINNVHAAETFSVVEDAKLSLSFGSTVILSNDLIAQQNYSEMAPNSVAAFGTYSPIGSAGPASYTSGSIFDAFLAPASDVMLSFSTLTSTTISGGGGNLTSGIHTSVGANVTVLFEYQPTTVPEPASLAMAAIGGLIVGVAGIARRRARPGLDR